MTKGKGRSSCTSSRTVLHYSQCRCAQLDDLTRFGMDEFDRHRRRRDDGRHSCSCSLGLYVIWFGFCTLRKNTYKHLNEYVAETSAKKQRKPHSVAGANSSLHWRAHKLALVIEAGGKVSPRVERIDRCCSRFPTDFNKVFRELVTCQLAIDVITGAAYSMELDLAGLRGSLCIKVT